MLADSDALALALSDALAEADADADSLADGLMLALSDADSDADALALADADSLADSDADSDAEPPPRLPPSQLSTLADADGPYAHSPADPLEMLPFVPDLSVPPLILPVIVVPDASIRTTSDALNAVPSVPICDHDPAETSNR